VRPYLKNNQRQKGWRHGSNGRTSTGFEFKSPILLRKKKGRKKRKKKKKKRKEKTLKARKRPGKILPSSDRKKHHFLGRTDTTAVLWSLNHLIPQKGTYETRGLRQ
jgi:hypothetical protein